MPVQSASWTFRAMAALLISSTLASCDATIVEPDEPVVLGPIASIQSAAEAVRIRVDALPNGGDACGIVATLDSRTRILIPADGGGFRSGSMEDLAVGDTVAVYVRGAVNDSCPLQGLASTIEKRRPGG